MHILKRIRRKTRWATRGVCVVPLLFLFGCAVGPDFTRPQPPSVESYTYETEPSTTVSAEGRTQHFERGADIPADWWRFFDSPELDAVVKEALARSPSLQAAQASLRESQENLRAGYGVFFPQLDGSFEAMRQKFSPARFGGLLSAQTPSAGKGSSVNSIFNLFTLTATVSYALDIFGGERRAVEGLRAQVDFQCYTMQAAYLALTGNVVNAVIAQAAYSAEIEATEEMIGLLKEQVRIAEIQEKAGIVPHSNVVSIRSQLAATEATLPPLRQKLSQALHLLALLVGRTPAEWAPPKIDLAGLSLPEDLPLTLPSQLVRQRPDILASEAQLHSASANIGVATAALYPNITLNGTYGLNNTNIEDLFKKTSSFWSLAADVSAPLFHGGTLWFRRKASIEAHNQSMANYRQTVLSAFAQVADTLRALEHDAEALQAQFEGLTAAEESLRLIQANYGAGLVNYLPVLIADGQYYQAKIGRLQALALRLQDTVGLFVALGGGWWNDDTAHQDRKEP